MSILQEFKEFAVKGNVVDMGVGIVIGAAFTSIVNSLVADIINPLIGVLTGGIDFSNLFVNLSGQDYASLSAAQDAGAATLNYGLFINAVISFLIVSWVLFLIIKGVNTLKRAAEAEAEAAPPPAPPKEEVLLAEIRDLLAKQSS
ncbi:MAG: large conductance mechanosensitive channel protein MscL [Pseudomonadota bacterium]